MPGWPRLMLVTDRWATRGRKLADVVAAAAAGGVGLVQVRERHLDDVDLGGLIIGLREAMPPDTILLVNDSVGLAVVLDIGLHLPSYRVHTAPGAEIRFGVSVHNDRELDAALAAGAHYLVAGTIFDTTCKPDLAGVGVEWITRARARAGDVPIYGIGGITADNAADVIRAGAHGVAVRSAILEADDPRAAAAELLAALPT